MHDIDRTTELEYEADNLETDTFEYDEFAEEAEYAGDTETTSPFNEGEEMEMAADLLEITDEAELDQFLGDLIKKVGRTVGRFIKSPLGRRRFSLLSMVICTAHTSEVSGGQRA